MVAEVASGLFGTEVTPERVIGETLDHATTGDPTDIRELSREVGNEGAVGDYDELSASSLASWIETTFGLAIEPGAGRVIRRLPARVRDSAARLAGQTGRTVDECTRAIRATLLAGSAARNPVSDRPLFAFRLQQFLSKSDTVYVSLITREKGNLLHADAEALVNTVNTVGIMGKGIALQFKRAYPAMFKAYERSCKDGDVQLRRMHVWETGALDGPQFVINFPTKGHWRSPSRLPDIVAGLADLVAVVKRYGISSIAIPPL